MRISSAPSNPIITTQSPGHALGGKGAAMKYRQFRLTHSLTQAKCAELLGVGERHWRTLEASNKPIALKHQVMLDYALKQGGDHGSP